MNKKLILLALIGVGIALFYVLELQQHLSLQSLKTNRDRLDMVYQENPTAVILGFIGIYFLVVALSLPGATILTLAGGAIFGSIVGTLIVNIGATLGAAVAFLAARLILRDWVEKRFADKLGLINEGLSENAVSYLLFLRLVPLFPFFLLLVIVRVPFFQISGKQHLRYVHSLCNGTDCRRASNGLQFLSDSGSSPAMPSTQSRSPGCRCHIEERLLQENIPAKDEDALH